MAIKLTRQTTKITLRDGVISGLDGAAELFQLQESESHGNFPSEQEDEDSLSLRIIKTDDGATVFLRFSQGLDRYTEIPVNGLSEAETIEEVCHIASDFIKALLQNIDDRSYRKEVGPGVFQAVTVGPKRDPLNDPESILETIYETLDRFIAEGMMPKSITSGMVAERGFNWSEGNFRFHLRDKNLPSYTAIRTEYTKTAS